MLVVARCAAGDGGGGSLAEKPVAQLILDVVCGVNRAKLDVNTLRRGSKNRCILVTSDGVPEHPPGVTN